MIHLTIWPSLTASEGGYVKTTWDALLAFFASPALAEDKNALEGWSPVRFAGNRRAKASVEAVSLIVLDDDASGLPLKRVVEIWSPFAGAIHTSHSHTEAAPKYRIVLHVSRDMTADEHARVWAFIAAHAARHGQILDTATRDASRFWFVPAHQAGAPYAWCELAGTALDVDAILATTPPVGVPALAMARPTATAKATDRRRDAMAAALGAAWPAKDRHKAQLALAGALRGEGYTAEEAVEFLCAVCRGAGNEDRAKREATVRHTYSLAEGSALTGWTRLKEFVDPVVVDAARGAIGREAEWTEKTNRRLAEIVSRSTPENDTASMPAKLPPHHVRTASGLVFRNGGWDEPLTPPVYVVEGLLVAGSVTLFVAHGSSLKSMTSLSIAAAVASGRPWLGRFVTRRGRAALLDFERSLYEARRRAKLLGVGNVGDLFYCAQPAARGDDPKMWEGLLELKPRLVVVDSLAAGAVGVDENETGAAKPLQLAQKFAAATGAAILFIHHARKGSGGDKREAVRGSTAIFAAADAVYTFEPLESPDGVKRMRVVCTKMNLGREPAPFAIELSDERGLVLFEEPAAVAGGNAETSSELRAAIRLALAQGPVAGVKALALKLRKQSKRVGAELAVMVESREVVCLKDAGGYQLDDDAKRTARVLAFVQAHGHESRFNTVTRLADAADVAPHDVERLLLAHVVERAVGNDKGGFVPGANWNSSPAPSPAAPFQGSGAAET